ncbi:protein-disulfide isomerase [Pedobacter sp. UYP30]|uniref:DsbA family protein n=1 Tax=Pedobacter sp. UYP30 TaxID=1756400 RepID=UPI003391B706
MMSKLKTAVNEEDHIQGSSDAKVIVVEYGDYECPHCAHAHQVLKNIVDYFKGQVALVFRNFLLTEVHPMAYPAAIAAEAAAKQGKFWEMNNGLFEHQDDLSEDLFIQLAEQLGLNVQQFQEDLDQSGELEGKIDADFEGGVRSGVNGTPSFYVNGEKFDGGAEDLFDMLRESSE